MTPKAPDFADLDFIYSWTLSSEFKVVLTNQVAKNLSDNPFDGLLDHDKSTLKEFIKSGGASNPELYLPWISPETNDSLWLKWKVKKHENYFHVFAVEVTDIKHSELYLRQILDSIPDMILVKGEDSKIVWANRAFQEHYHLNREELKEMIDAPFAEPDFTKQYIVDDKKVWDTGKPLLIECEPVVRYDGVVKKFQTLKTPIFGPNKKVLFTVGVSRDITEKIEHEEKSITAAKMAAIGEMAGGMAHEINNPMAVIAGKVFMLRRSLEKNSEINKNMVLNYLDTIQHHVERISLVIDTLRKLSVDDDYEDFSKVNVKKLITDTLILCETKIREKGIDLVVNVPDEIEIEARSIQLSQAVLNLLNNATDAVEFSKQKWIKLEALVSDENCLEIMVLDSGPGVPEEILGKIMQPFFTTKEVGKGSGLGLSFALSVARNHHGSLKVDTDISPSCFILKIPVKQKKN